MTREQTELYRQIAKEARQNGMPDVEEYLWFIRRIMDHPGVSLDRVDGQIVLRGIQLKEER